MSQLIEENGGFQLIPAIVVLQLIDEILPFKRTLHSRFSKNQGNYQIIN